MEPSLRSNPIKFTPVYPSDQCYSHLYSPQSHHLRGPVSWICRTTVTKYFLSERTHICIHHLCGLTILLHYSLYFVNYKTWGYRHSTLHRNYHVRHHWNSRLKHCGRIGTDLLGFVWGCLKYWYVKEISSECFASRFVHVVQCISVPHHMCRSSFLYLTPSYSTSTPQTPHFYFQNLWPSLSVPHPCFITVPNIIGGTADSLSVPITISRFEHESLENLLCT